MNILKIVEHLHKADLLPVLAWAREYVKTASYGDICALVESFPERSRGLLKVLLQDVLCGFPHIVHGIPVLMRYSHPKGKSFQLPLPEHAPDPDITSISWLPLSILRSDEPFQPNGAPVFIDSDRTACEILVVTTHSVQSPTLPEKFWSELLLPEAGSIRISARMSVDFATGVEAGAAMLAAAMTGGYRVDTPKLWLNDSAWHQAQDAGVAWWRSHHLSTDQEDI